MASSKSARRLLKIVTIWSDLGHTTIGTFGEIKVHSLWQAGLLKRIDKLSPIRLFLTQYFTQYINMTSLG